jgi:hypothetical protein
LRRIPDDCDHLPEAAALGFGNERVEQRAADSQPVRLGRDVDGIFHAPAVRRSGPIRPRIGIAQHGPVALRDEVRITASENRPPTARHFGSIGRLELEGRGPEPDRMGVNGGDGIDVRRFGGADQELRHCSPAQNDGAPAFAGAPHAATFSVPQRRSPNRRSSERNRLMKSR